MFSEAEAARLLDVVQNTLHYWLEGGRMRGRTYRPIIRIEPKGNRAPITWAEFIEAGWLRQYRREHGVPMAGLRGLIDSGRGGAGGPDPLAPPQPLLAGGGLLRPGQNGLGGGGGYCPFRPGRGE